MTPDDRTLAAELALGLLDEAERADALARVMREPEFAEEVAWWRSHFDGLFADYKGAAPSERLAQRIEEAAAERQADVASIQRRRGWRWFAGGTATGAIAAALAVLAVGPMRAPERMVAAPSQKALLAAAVQPAAGRTGTALPVIVDPDARSLRVAISPDVPARRAAELWRIGADGVPHPLGILRTTGATQLRVTVSLRAGDTLAISIEPLGGSPEAKPTGPVIATGKLVAT